MTATKPTILCLASYFKGGRFLEACKRAGANVLLLTREKLADEPWPMDAIDERFLMPDLHRQPDVTHTVSYLARSRAIDRIIALDEYDTLTVSGLREHLRVPGMGETTGRYFRDKLAMRVRAREAGLQVPDFIHVLNHDALAAFMQQGGGPWVLKPRAEASAMGIKKIHSEAECRQALETLGDRQSDFLLEQFVPGDVFHVDAVVWDGEVIFSAVHQYGAPPMDVYQGGGVFATRTLPYGGETTKTLNHLNRQLLSAFGMVRGVTHGEFIRSRDDGQFHFLEVAARVGGAGIDQLVEAATGLNLWEAWAELEVAAACKDTYHLAPTRTDYAALLVCLAHQEHPDLSSYADPEVVWRLDKPHHAGLIIASSDEARVDALLQDYTRRFAEEFLTTRPPLEKAPE